MTGGVSRGGSRGGIVGKEAKAERRGWGTRKLQSQTQEGLQHTRRKGVQSLMLPSENTAYSELLVYPWPRKALRGEDRELSS